MSIVRQLARVFLGPTAGERVEDERDKAGESQPKPLSSESMHRQRLLETNIRERCYFISGIFCTGAWPDKPEFLQGRYEVEQLLEDLRELQRIYEEE